MGAWTERAEGQKGTENEVDLKRRKKEEKQGERALCCGGVNILELLPAVQKVTANINVCMDFFKSLWSVILYVCMHMHVYTTVYLIVCYFLLGIFTTMVVSDRVFICGSCRVQSFFCIVLL